MKFSKYLLPPALYRRKVINSSMRRQKRVANIWNPIIDDYFEGKIEKYNLQPKKQFREDVTIIWQYWGQGIDNGSVPELVQICFNSVDRYKQNYEVIRLSDENISEYVDIPDFVLRKKNNNPTFTITFFSDLLRLILLNVYGGIWMDATILLTNYLPEEYTKHDYFLFQRDEDEAHKDYWIKVDPYYFNWHPDFKVKMLSSIIFAKKSSEVIRCLLDIMLCFWKKSEKLSYYFTLQVIYNELIRRKLAHLQCPVVSDCTPHIIQKKISMNYPYASFEEAFNLSPIHKMSYYNKEKLRKLKENLRRLES